MSDLEKIRKYYGEKMMHLCRTLFPTLLENENQLWEILTSSFYPSKFLYNDVVNQGLELEFKDYIMSLSKPKVIETNVNKTPSQLLNQKNYTLYECTTEEEIQQFKKYYYPGEELCTFNGNRLKDCYVFFAIKKNINQIKRENYKNPRRQDKYGTSIISIQFTKGKINTLSIKNRYNSVVFNPDATFSNNLDNIIPGLTKSFENEYNLNINQNVGNGIELKGYIKANDGKYYKYNYEINNIYYCPDNIIIKNLEVKKFNQPERFILFDYFILDLQSKTIELYDKSINDSFIHELKNIKKIEITKQEEGKLITIIFNNDTKAYIEIDKTNQIKSYQNENIKEIKDNFLYYNKSLENINIKLTTKIGNNFLYHNKNLKELSLPIVTTIEDNFLTYNECLEQINVINIKHIGNNFLKNNKKLMEILLPQVINIGDNFLKRNKILKSLNVLKVEKVSDNFLLYNEELTQIDMPNAKIIGDNFIFWNEKIDIINIPNVKLIGDCFLNYNNRLKKLFLPEVIKIKEDFLYYNEILEDFYAPKIEQIGDLLLYNNIMLNKIDITNIKIIGERCLYNNECLEEINMPNVQVIGNDFIHNNPILKEMRKK